MALIKTAILAGLGYAGYRYFTRQQQTGQAAFAAGQGGDGNFAQVRDAGPEAMASDQGGWTRVDEASDESFPASDPPANY